MKRECSISIRLTGARHFILPYSPLFSYLASDDETGFTGRAILLADEDKTHRAQIAGICSIGWYLRIACSGV